MSPQSEREKVAHLLRRFGLGASEAEIDFYGSSGYTAAVDKLLNYESVEDVDLPLQLFQNGNGNINIQAVQLWWGTKLVMTRRPLQEKMTLFWHDHFATSAQKVTTAPLMHDQNQIFRANALGEFKTLLTEVSKDPAMLFWLDNQFNVKGKPNENFAREIMELFTLGIGHYSEKDIQEGARAFTGWTIGRNRRPVQGAAANRLPRNIEFTFNRQAHDDGPKSFLGSTAPFDGDDIISILCSNPQTSKAITRKIWEFFVYEAPDAKTVEKYAAEFAKSNLNIKALLRSIMLSPEFQSDKAKRALYKNPADFCISSLRALGVGASFDPKAIVNAEGVVQRGRLAPVLAGLQAMKSMGMEIFFPPDVAGWDHGANWITSATMVERIGWSDRIFPLAAPGQGNRKAVFNYPIFNLISDDPTPEKLVDTLISVLDAPIDSTKRNALMVVAKKQGATLNQQTARAAANGVAKLIFGSPDFQFC